MERTFESGDNTRAGLDGSAAASRLFADAYDLTSRSAQSKDVTATVSNQPQNGEQPASGVGDKIPSEAAYDDPYASIYRNVTTEAHTMASGETLESIARRNLGNGASEQEVQDYLQEIRDVNSGSDFAVGNTVVLPGHTADGDIVMPNKDGTTYTISGDPAQRYLANQQLMASLPPKPPTGDATQSSGSGGAAGQNQQCYPSYVDVEVFSRDGRTINHMREAYMNCPGRPREPISPELVPWVNAFPWLRR